MHWTSRRIVITAATVGLLLTVPLLGAGKVPFVASQGEIDHGGVLVQLPWSPTGALAAFTVPTEQRDAATAFQATVEGGDVVAWGVYLFAHHAGGYQLVGGNAVGRHLDYREGQALTGKAIRSLDVQVGTMASYAGSFQLPPVDTSKLPLQVLVAVTGYGKDSANVTLRWDDGALATPEVRRDDGFSLSFYGQAHALDGVDPVTVRRVTNDITWSTHGQGTDRITVRQGLSLRFDDNVRDGLAFAGIVVSPGAGVDIWDGDVDMFDTGFSVDGYSTPLSTIDVAGGGRSAWILRAGDGAVAIQFEAESVHGRLDDGIGVLAFSFEADMAKLLRGYPTNHQSVEVGLIQEVTDLIGIDP